LDPIVACMVILTVIGVWLFGRCHELAL